MRRILGMIEAKRGTRRGVCRKLEKAITPAMRNVKLLKKRAKEGMVSQTEYDWFTSVEDLLKSSLDQMELLDRMTELYLRTSKEGKS